jgi:hypothetical protein
MWKIDVYAVAVVGFFLAVMAPVALADERIFFFGNSYTYFHGGMELYVKALLEEALNTTVEARRSTYNGGRLPAHLADLDGTNGDTSQRQALITGNNTSWDLVVLQDQSVVPALLFSNIWEASLAAGAEIHRLIQPSGAVTMFLETWGRQGQLDAFFTSFTFMQEYLTRGIREYQKAAKEPVRSFVAPAGRAFQLVYEDTIAAGGTNASAPFSQLYKDDGSHPDVQGAYLSACVIYAAYTGRSVAELEWAPNGIDAERRDYLQTKADEAVFDDTTFYPRRWDLPDFVSPFDKLELTEPPVSPPVAPTTSPSAAPSVGPSVAPSVSPLSEPSGAPSDMPISPNGNLGLSAVENATETSTAPRTASIVTDMLLLAALAWAVSM